MKFKTNNKPSWLFYDPKKWRADLDTEKAILLESNANDINFVDIKEQFLEGPTEQALPKIVVIISNVTVLQGQIDFSFSFIVM